MGEWPRTAARWLQVGLDPSIRTLEGLTHSGRAAALLLLESRRERAPHLTRRKEDKEARGPHAAATTAPTLDFSHQTNPSSGQGRESSEQGSRISTGVLARWEAAPRLDGRRLPRGSKESAQDPGPRLGASLAPRGRLAGGEVHGFKAAPSPDTSRTLVRSSHSPRRSREHHCAGRRGAASCWGGSWARGGGGPLPLASATVELSVSMV